MKTSIKILSTVVLFTGLIACGAEEKPTEDQVISIEDASKEDLMDEDKMIVVSNDSVGPSEVLDGDKIMLDDATETDLMDEGKMIVVSNDSEGPSEVSDGDIIMLEEATEADLMDENKMIVVVADDEAEK